MKETYGRSGGETPMTLGQALLILSRLITSDSSVEYSSLRVSLVFYLSYRSYTDEEDYKDYLERMNTHTYELVDAALRHPSIQVDVWGPGWAGYDASLPLSVNVKRRSWRIYRLEKARKEWERRVRTWEAEVEERMREISGRAWWDWADVRDVMQSKMTVRGSGRGLLLDGVEVTRMKGYPGKFIPPEWGENEEDQDCNDQVKWDIVWTIS